MKKPEYYVEDGHFYMNRKRPPRRKADYEYDGYKFWFKEMISTAGQYNIFKMCVCPLTGLILFIEGSCGDTDWSYEEEYVQKAYVDWITEESLLK